MQELLESFLTIAAQHIKNSNMVASVDEEVVRAPSPAAMFCNCTLLLPYKSGMGLPIRTGPKVSEGASVFGGSTPSKAAKPMAAMESFGEEGEEEEEEEEED
jgi:hypothetical protein